MNLRWGLVGYGDLAGKRVAAALREARGSQLEGVWGRLPDKTTAFAKQHAIPHAHPSLAALVQSEIDAVYVCTPPESHAEYALAAIAAGKHALVEKPMAASVAECEQMLQAARARRVTLGVAYYRRAFPKMQRIKELIAGGLLGTPTWVNIACHSWFSPSVDDPRHWRVEPARSGGVVADIGAHRFDLLDYWLGPARLVFHDAHRLVQPYAVEDGCSLVLKLANGAPVQAYFAWNSQTWIDRFEIVGSDGKLIAEPLDGPALTILRGRDREELNIPPPANAHQPCVEDFVDAVRAQRAPLCDGAAGLRTNQLLEQLR